MTRDRQLAPGPRLLPRLRLPLGDPTAQSEARGAAGPARVLAGGPFGHRNTLWTCEIGEYRGSSSWASIPFRRQRKLGGYRQWPQSWVDFCGLESFGFLFGEDYLQ